MSPTLFASACRVEAFVLNLRLVDPSTFLCIGAHADDIEIGCGGTLAQWAASYPRARFVWAVFSGDAVRIAETRAASKALLGDGARVDLRLYDFRDSFFPAHYAEIKEAVAALRQEFSPDVVLTHFERDRHQDHRLLSELTATAFRDHLVLEYEIPKYDGDLGQPNVYLPLSESVARKKVESLLACFASQRNHQWFTAETFFALMRLRGIECRAPSGFAECFHARKLVVGT
jgi:LmbE family N-acetylglucosaminyl deacetylase